MKKTAFCVLFVIFTLAFALPLSAQGEDALQKGYSYSAANTIYIQYDAWAFFGPNMKIVTDKNPKGIYFGTEDFKNFIKKIPASYKEYQNYEAKTMLGTVTMLGSELLGVGVVYLGAASNSTSTTLYVTGGALLVMMAGLFIGSGFHTEGMNSFYKSIDLYNKAVIYAGFRQGGMPAITYKQEF